MQQEQAPAHQAAATAARALPPRVLQLSRLGPRSGRGVGTSIFACNIYYMTSTTTSYAVLHVNVLLLLPLLVTVSARPRANLAATAETYFALPLPHLRHRYHRAPEPIWR